MRPTALGSTLLIGFTAVVHAMPAQGGYTFTSIVESGFAAPSGTFSGFQNGPALSGGTVAFEGLFGNFQRGIFTGRGGSISTIVKLGDAAPLGTFSGFGLRGPAISGGTTVFYGRYASDSTFAEGIFAGRGGVVTAIAKTGDAAPYGQFRAFQDPAVSGPTTSFAASFYKPGDISGNVGVFNITAGVSNTIATLSGDAPTRSFTMFGAPAVSGGTAAFFGNFSGTGGLGQGIFVGGGGSPTALLKTGDPAPQGAFSAFGTPGISGGTAAFHATYNNGAGSGVFLADGRGIATVAKTGDISPFGAFRSFGPLVSVSHGEVAFTAVTDGGTGGIFTSVRGQVTAVIRGGDRLFNSSVLSLNLGTLGLDEDGTGRLAFYYELFNGRRGIAVATPMPERAGDYDGDGDVDGADFLVWQRQFNKQVSPGSGADGDRSGHVDGFDERIWRDGFGTVKISRTVVSEPTSIVLSICVAASAAFCRNRRREVRR